MRKSEVATHGGIPACNVKVRTLLQSPEGVPEDVKESIFWSLCDDARERANDLALELWGKGVVVFSAGRSGGWWQVSGLPDVDTWDAVDLARWARFARYCRDTVKDFPRAFEEACASWLDGERERIEEEKRTRCPACNGTGRILAE